MTNSQHAKLSASGAHRWAYCLGSTQLAAQYPNRSSSYSHEGTVAHHIGALCLESGQDVEAYAYTVYHVIEKTDADGNTWTRVSEFYLDLEENEKSVFSMAAHDGHVEHIQAYVDYVRRLVAETGGTLLVEKRVNFSPWVPGGFGTSDAIIVCPDQTVHVIDLKYGRGVEVNAEANDQARLYSLGTYNDYDLLYEFKRFVAHVVQPRINNYSTETLTIQELLQHADWIKLRAELALDPEMRKSLGYPDFTPGEKQCGFCPARAECKARAEMNLQLAIVEFSQFDAEAPMQDLEVKKDDLRNVAKLSPAQISTLLSHADEFDAWLADLRARGHELAAEGKLPGWKMVEGRSVRKWTGKAVPALTAALKEKGLPADAIYKPRDLIGIGDAEKLLGKKHPVFSPDSDAIEKPEGKPTLAPESDKRPALKLAHETAAADFAEAAAEDDLYS